MAKKGYISVRVDPSLKREVNAILATVGVTTTEALTMFFHQIILRRGLPFEVRLPPARLRGAPTLNELNTPADIAPGSNEGDIDTVLADKMKYPPED